MEDFRTGSARSVGPRRVKKDYQFSTQIVQARSATEARMISGLHNEAPRSAPLNSLTPAKPGGGGGVGGGGGATTIAPGTVPILPATGLPVTGNQQGNQNAVVTFNMGASTLNAAGTVTIIYNIGVADVTITVAVASGDTANTVATKVAAEIDKIAGLGGSTRGNKAVVTPDDTVVLSKLTVTMA